MKFDRHQTFSLYKCCTIQHFFCFPRCCVMFYSFGDRMQFFCTLLYSCVQQFSRHIPLFTMPREILFANFVNCILAIFAFGYPFSLFLTCAHLLIFQSFKKKKHGQIFLKKCFIVLYEVLHSFVHPSVNTIKEHATVCNICPIMFYEMFYSFGRGLIVFSSGSQDQ